MAPGLQGIGTQPTPKRHAADLRHEPASEDFAPAFAAKAGLEGKSLEELATEEKVVAAVQEGVDSANAKLARVEQIKKFFLVEGDWLPGGDEITPTMKLKRKPIAAKYDSQISGLY